MVICKKRWLFSLIAILLLELTAFPVRAQVPPRPEPSRLVNDFAGILGECQWLEDSLDKIALETSNQICVVTMNDFGGLDKAMMANKIGDEWGVGTKEKSNGVIILIKPKTEEANGEAFIATGLGLEGAIPDTVCTRIVTKEMIPHFQENDYPAGVWAGAKVVRALAVGEYSGEEYLKEDDMGIFGMIITSGIVLLLLYLLFRCFKDFFVGLINLFRPKRKSAATQGSDVERFSDSNDDQDDMDDDLYDNDSSSDSDEPSWGGYGGGTFHGGGGGASW